MAFTSRSAPCEDHGKSSRGKNFAIMESGRIRLAGIIPWFLWAFIHIMFLPQLQNQRRVQNQWFWSYFTGQRSSRLVDEPPRI